MFVPSGLDPRRGTSYAATDYENSPEHLDLTKRLCKTLYYGKKSSGDHPSLPLTEIAVEFFQDSAPRSLGKVDMYLASSMTRCTCITPCSVMLGILYVKRLRQNNPEYLMQVSSSDLFLISMMMASKYLYDEGVDEEVFNDEWAESNMVDLGDLNEMEQTFLAAIDWRLFIRHEEFHNLLAKIERQIALNEGLKRGWLSYTDFWVLIKGSLCHMLWKDVGLEVAKVVFVSTLAYIAGLLTMLGSVALVPTLSTGLAAISCPAEQPVILPFCSDTIRQDQFNYQRRNLSKVLTDSSVHQMLIQHLWLPTFTQSSADIPTKDDAGLAIETSVQASFENHLVDLSSKQRGNEHKEENLNKTWSLFLKPANISLQLENSEVSTVPVSAGGAVNRMPYLCCQHKLSHLWALLSLKASLVQFVYAAEEKYIVHNISDKSKMCCSNIDGATCALQNDADYLMLSKCCGFCQRFVELQCGAGAWEAETAILPSGLNNYAEWNAFRMSNIDTQFTCSQPHVVSPTSQILLPSKA